VFSHVTGALAVIEASLVKVTAKVPPAATVRAVASVWALPDVDVA
jgi:hypothetical protein